MSKPYKVTTTLPQFSKIDPEKLVSELEILMQENISELKDILSTNIEHTWDTLVVPLTEMDDRLNKFWSPIRHLHSVADNDALRKAYNNCLETITNYSTEILQNHDLYLAYKKLSDSEHYRDLNLAQKKVIENSLREFKLSGVGLDQKDKGHFKQIVQELASLQAKLEDNVLDSTHDWSKHFVDSSILEGLPETAIELAKQNAADKKLAGWLITLDFPSYYPVMQYAEDESLRQELYRAYVTRSSDQSPGSHEWDNSKLIERILTLRLAKAKLLGFETYAEYSLSRKMAETPEEVLTFLYDLAKRTIDTAKNEFNELSEFANKHHGQDTLNPWDVSFYSEKLRQHKFNFTQEDLKAYFPAPSVLSGLFSLVNRLYGLTIKENHEIDVWHSDVRFFEIYDIQGERRGGFYLDIYARRQKRGGAWMDECIVRKKLGDDLQQPIAFLSCNFTPPGENRPALLTHDEVTTLFHEFGHGLHHMLTLVDYPSVSGINGVPWDAVELPSQFMENWCWGKKSLDLIGKHFKTGELLPDELFMKMLHAKNFQSAMQMVRQIEFALFDFRLHYEENNYTQQSIQSLLDEIREKTAVIKPPSYNRFQNSFTHIFSGGYAAGYYSYKWAEVLSADAFSKFEDNGIFDRQTGEEFLHTILEQGGSREPMDLFIEFRGRKPSIEPLLRHSGIISTGVS
jgi:oligopeptidase A